jgi:peptidoglycan/LPS O-acetylase OafA/YrhL
VGIFLISPGLLLTQETPWMYTYGFSLLYLGFGAILLGALGAPIELMPGALQFFARILAFVGRFSYSIYLWHIPFLIFLAAYGFLRKPYLGVGTFLAGSIALGVLTSELFEIPVIRLRDALFPRSSAKVQAHGSDSTTRTELGISPENSKPARVPTL